jgi:hypothetical protein
MAMAAGWAAITVPVATPTVLKIWVSNFGEANTQTGQLTPNFELNSKIQPSV